MAPQAPRFFPQLGLRPRATLLLAHGLAQLSNSTLPALPQFGQWLSGSMAAHQTKRLLPDSGLRGTFELAGPILGW